MYKLIMPEKFSHNLRRVFSDNTGVHAIYCFPNGYCASVINSSLTNGSIQITVLKDGLATYDTAITDDVIVISKEGDAVNEISETLQKISELSDEKLVTETKRLRDKVITFSSYAENFVDAINEATQKANDYAYVNNMKIASISTAISRATGRGCLACVTVVFE